MGVKKINSRYLKVEQYSNN